MARPNKNSADYFSHDNSMRNHRKIKVLRQQYSASGYATYLMLLETLTGSEHFQIQLGKEMDWKILASDFGIKSEKLKKIIKLMEELELIQNNDDLIECESLNERLQPLLDKRLKRREVTKSMSRDDKGKFLSSRSDGVSLAETPQSKVNKNKVNKSKLNNIVNREITPYQVARDFFDDVDSE